MTYLDFKNEILSKVSSKLPPTYTICIEEVCKNNGVYLDSLIISQPEINISPSLYMDEYFSIYEQEPDMDMVVDKIILDYKIRKVDSTLDVSGFTEFDRIKDNIVFKLINKEKNIQMLEGIPWRSFLDLAITYSIWIDSFCDTCDTYGTILINNKFLKLWDLKEENLYELAMTNSIKNLPCDIRSLPDFFNSIAGEIIVKENDPITNMYVVTNKTRLHGAACILYPNIIKNFAKSFKRDLFILPSSIHELIILIDSGDIEKDKLNELIVSINDSQVPPIEQLSDHVYKYLWKEDRIVY